MCENAVGPECSVLYGGVQYVDTRFSYGALGHVIDAEGDWQGKGEGDHLVGGAFLEDKGRGPRDAGSRENWTGVVAGRNLGG